MEAASPEGGDAKGHKRVCPGAGALWSPDLGSGHTECSLSNTHWAAHLDVLVFMWIWKIEEVLTQVKKESMDLI